MGLTFAIASRQLWGGAVFVITGMLKIMILTRLFQTLLPSLLTTSHFTQSHHRVLESNYVPLLSEEGTPWTVQGLLPERQSQDLALTVVYVPHSLDCGHQETSFARLPQETRAVLTGGRLEKLRVERKYRTVNRTV